MKKLIYYRPRVVLDKYQDKYPALKKFRHYYNIYAWDVSFFDRSNVIKIPFNIKNVCPIPALRPFDKTYEQVCNERAKELLNKSEKLNVPIRIMYSGGVDSTCVVVSFLKNATEEQKKRIIVLLSEESIQENPRFYEEHIIGKVKVEPSIYMSDHLGKKNTILVTGDLNDQLLGAEIMAKFIRNYSFDFLVSPYTREKIVGFFNTLNDKHELNNFYFDLFDELCKKAPVKIETVYDFFWWIIFTCKWQYTHYRTLMYTKQENIKNIDEDYIKNYFFTFYNSEDFQLWSMLNMDKKIKNDWKSYKYIAKEVIYNFNHDEEYFKNKAKVGSFFNVAQDQNVFSFMDENFHLSQDLPIEEIYNPDNSFN